MHLNAELVWNARHDNSSFIGIFFLVLSSRCYSYLSSLHHFVWSLVPFQSFRAARAGRCPGDVNNVVYL